MKKFVMIALSVVGFSSMAMADTDYGVEVGIRQQSGDTDITGASTDSQNGIQFGGFAHFQLVNNLHLRTGMLYTERPLVVKTPAEIKVKMTYLDVPVTLLYKFEEGAGVYAGISLSNKLGATSDGATDPTDVTSPLIPIIFGAFFKFHPNFGVNIYYEMASGKVAENLENYRAVGANLMVTFD